MKIENKVLWAKSEKIDPMGIRIFQEHMSYIGPVKLWFCDLTVQQTSVAESNSTSLGETNT